MEQPGLRSIQKSYGVPYLRPRRRKPPFAAANETDREAIMKGGAAGGGGTKESIYEPCHASYISVSCWIAGNERRSSKDLGKSSGSFLGSFSDELEFLGSWSERAGESPRGESIVCLKCSRIKSQRRAGDSMRGALAPWGGYPGNMSEPGVKTQRGRRSYVGSTGRKRRGRRAGTVFLTMIDSDYVDQECQ